ncbi:Uncharacterised protein (plasmid) [Tsukamurella tyrosinosolvens]|uniref:Uncharacterized protein n=1 Tax=Tsukamurella tyrosinosolvens TaxID=57704 RepID=A0A1H4VED0_TSUTY|nr:hypothetical protein [Tsukamurella tyrosinosolvens]KXO90999.1 hypothetical protein AXK58_21450 [Tsukamurella tyrosinosolvens]SEC79316.1 hypothetical protein SAMN04489793_3203 [Tsukamurella tyrosinosolvens]VEH90568.1 Uncharacterised protein [Tsukamurella tyrosinosolvens]
MIIDIEPGKITIHDAAHVGLEDQVVTPDQAENVAADLDSRRHTTAGAGLRNAARQARGER